MPKIGRYEYSTDGKNLLGKGAFSHVYLGRYRGRSVKYIKKGTIVAIKIVETVDLTSRAKRVLEDEISIMEMIKENPHPNIVTCYDIIREVERSRVYIIMEYCDSGDLRNILIGKAIREQYVQFYFSQFANGLRYLADNRIIHRDIKPRNILLTNNKQLLKIADFGFARKMADNSMYDTICGSPLYMAPEIMSKESYNNQTDLWSIGMILYEMLFGIHPFQHCKDIPELRCELEKTVIVIPPENNANYDVSSTSISLLKDLLQKDVDHRISWANFFSHEWINKYKDVSDKTNNQNSKYDEYRSTLNSVSIGSLKDRCVPNQLLNNNNNNNENDEVEITIIDNYLDKSTLNIKYTDCIFDIEIDEVVEKSSVLPQFNNNSRRYDVIKSVS